MASDFPTPLERIDASGIATFIIGDHSVILHANPAAAVLIGLAPSDLIGQALDLPFAPGETREVEMIAAGDVVQAIRIVTESSEWEGQAVFEVALHPMRPPAAAPAPALATPPPAAPAPPPPPPAPVPVPVAAPAPIPVPAPAPAPPPQPAAAPALPAKDGPPGKPLRILILEDDLAIGDIQCRMLKTLGYLTTWAKTGEEAIDACKAAVAEGDRFSGALLDLTIHGGMGGRDAVKVLKQIDPALQAIACSGYSDDELNQELMKDGFIDILPKPFRSQELGKILKKNVG